MPSYTPNYNLALYNSTTDNTQLFLDYRLAQAGTAISSNMYLIDTAMYGLQTQITSLGSQKGLIKVYATTVTTNNFAATGITGIVTYITNTTIILALDASITGAATLNINSLGAKNLKKINSSGSIVSLDSNDLMLQKFFIFTYDGTQWIWDNALSSEQINVPSGTTGNFVSVSSSKNMQDSGYKPADFAVAAKGVTNGDSHDHVGGDGAQIDYTGLSNLPSYKTGLFFQEDFITFNTTSGSSSFLYNSGVLVSGTFSKIDATSAHSGIANILSSTSANSGGYLTTGSTTISSFILNGLMETNIIFQTSVVTSTTLRIGFSDSYTTTAPVDGVWINISAATLDGRTANNSTSSTTGTSYTISASTWYRANIQLNSGATTATFTLYDVPTTTTLWTNTLSTNIPTARSTNYNLFGIRTAATTAAVILAIDYFDLKYSLSR